MKRIVVLALALLPFAVQAQDLVKDSDHQRLYKTEGAFEEVKENIVLAIENQGLVINYIAQVGGMLERTGNDLGFTDHTYSAGDVLEFCSADLTRKMVAADPSNLVFCPYAVHVYELSAEPGVVYVGYKRPVLVGNQESQDSLQAIDDLLAAIVRDSLAW